MGKDDATWLNISYVIFALLVAYVAFQAMEMVVVQLGMMARIDAWYPLASRLSALALGFGGAFYMRAPLERRDYHLKAIGEIRKVTWPTIDLTKSLTMVVVVVVAIFSVILTVFDMVWAKLLEFILG